MIGDSAPATGKKRLFLALAVPPAVAENLARVSRRLKKDFGEREISFRFSPPENFHVTLVFLGNTDRIEAVAAAAKAAATQISPFDIEVRGIGAFPDLRSARVIWAGVPRTKEIVAAKLRVEESLAPLGFSPEAREFHPHLTLARTRNVHSVEHSIDSFRRTDFGEIQVSEIVLYESVPKIPYPEYRPLERIPLLKKN